MIAAVGQDGGLWFFWQGIGDAVWSPPQQVPALVPISSASVTQVGNASGIAAIGQDGSLWFFWQIIGTEPWETRKVASAGSVNAGI